MAESNGNDHDLKETPVSAQPAESSNTVSQDRKINNDEDDLEEGELKDDDDDDDEDDDPPPPPTPTQPQMNHHHQQPQSGNGRTCPPYPSYPPCPPGPPVMYRREGAPPGNVGPAPKVNIRCRFYSKTSNKCTWGDHCRFEHRDDSPGPELDTRPQPIYGVSSNRGGPPGAPPMGPADRGSPYPPYSGRHQPYPPPPPHGYPPYDPYGPPHHHSTPPPLPPHSMSHHWRQQHSPYPTPSSTHPPESISPALLPTPGGASGSSGSSGNRLAANPTGSSSSGAGGSLTTGGAPSPGYPSPFSSSSSSVVYERKHRLAYEVAPWNDRVYPPPSKYDRGGDTSGAYPPPTGSRGSFYRNNNFYNNREQPYGREPMPHMTGPYPGYPTYPSTYRGGSMGPHASHFKFMNSSQRSAPPDARRPRSNKRGHDEDESSWSDSGSDDSILGQANYGSNRSHVTKASKHHHQQQQQQQPAADNIGSDEPPDQGSGTPPGEPLPEDRERQEMLLNKLKEIEDLMAKKKGEQEDPM